MIKFYSSIFILLSIFVLISCGSSKNAVSKSGINFIYDNQLSKVLDKAEQKGKLVFLDFYADWCGPCKMMDRDVFTYPQLKNRLNADFLNMKVDTDDKNDGSELGFIFQVSILPTFIVVDHRGRVLQKLEGSQSISGMNDFLDRAQIK